MNEPMPPVGPIRELGNGVGGALRVTCSWCSIPDLTSTVGVNRAEREAGPDHAPSGAEVDHGKVEPVWQVCLARGRGVMSWVEMEESEAGTH